MPEPTNYEKAMDIMTLCVRPQTTGAVEYQNADTTGITLALLAIADEVRALREALTRNDPLGAESRGPNR